MRYSKFALLLIFFCIQSLLFAGDEPKKFDIESEIIIEFKIGHKGTSAPEAIFTRKEKIKPLGYNSKFSRGFTFDDFTEIVSLRYDYRGYKYDIPYSITNLSGENIFHDDTKIAYFERTFDNPDNSFEYSCIRKYKDLKYLTQVFLNDIYPLKSQKIILIIPNWLEVEIFEFNFPGFSIKKEEESILEGKKIIYSVSNTEGFTNLENAPSISQIYPHLLLSFKSYTLNNKKTTILSSTQDLYNWYHSLVNQIYVNNNQIIPFVNSLIKDCKTDREKIEKIYYWVQDNIRYIAFENGIMGFKPESANNVFNNLYGDCKGMSNLLKEMLKIAGFDARLCWLGTYRIPYDYSISSLAVDNHMICAVFLGDERLFIDPTEEFSSLEDIAQRIQSRSVLIENDENYILDKIPEKKSTDNLEKKDISLTLDNKILNGTQVIIYSGEEKTNMFQIYHNISSTNRTDFLQAKIASNNQNMVVLSVIDSSFEQRNKPLRIMSEFTVKNQISEFGEEIYLDININKEFYNSKIDTSRRIDFVVGTKNMVTSTTIFSIPEGMKVTYFPPKFSCSNDDFSFEFFYSNQGKNVVLTKKIDFKDWKIRKVNFPYWNESIDKINDFYNDQLILKKI